MLESTVTLATDNRHRCVHCIVIRRNITVPWPLACADSDVHMSCTDCTVTQPVVLVLYALKHKRVASLTSIDLSTSTISGITDGRLFHQPQSIRRHRCRCDAVTVYAKSSTLRPRVWHLRNASKGLVPGTVARSLPHNVSWTRGNLSDRARDKSSSDCGVMLVRIVVSLINDHELANLNWRSDVER